MSYIPKVGDAISVKDFDMIMEAVRDRKINFPDEPAAVSMATIFFNIGNRFASVRCVAEEWEGLKQDIPPTKGIPMCPNGHVLFEGPGLRLGWIAEENYHVLGVGKQ